MALLLCCYLASIILLVLALDVISRPAYWSPAAYYVVYLMLFAVFLETLLVAGLVLSA